jgi:hypothetical protein
VGEPDAVRLGAKLIEKHRRGFYADFGDRFIPVWHTHTGTQELDRLCGSYTRVGIHEDAIEKPMALAIRANGLVKRHGIQLHALASAKPDDPRSVRFATATTGSWLNPTRYGVTIGWDGRKLHRHPARLKDQAREHRCCLRVVAGLQCARNSKNHSEGLGIGGTGPAGRGPSTDDPQPDHLRGHQELHPLRGTDQPHPGHDRCRALPTVQAQGTR